MEKVVISCPREDLLYGKNRFLWPGILDETEIKKLANIRLRLYDGLNFLFRCLDIFGNINDLARNGDASDISQASLVYHELATFISQRENQRVILYLPFELFPNSGEELGALSGPINEFTSAYLSAWHNILPSRDLRVNFFDGDIPDDSFEYDSHPMVCKAAHLIPFLIQKGLLSVDQVCNLFRLAVFDTVLSKSIGEGVSASISMGITSYENWFSRLGKNQLVWLPACEKRSEGNFRSSRFSSSIPLVNEDDSLSGLFEQAWKMWCLYESNAGIIPQHRLSWEMKSEKKAIIGYYSTIIAKKLGKDFSGMKFNGCDIDKNFLNLLSIKSLEIAVEETFLSDPDFASDRANNLHNWFLDRFSSPDMEVKELIEGVLYRWFHLGIINYQFLSLFGLNQNSWDEDSSAIKFFQEENDEVQRALKILEVDQLAHDMYFSVFATYGSKIKGFGKYSDFDVAAFIRPVVPYKYRDGVDLGLEIMLPSVNHPFQFWLGDDGERLSIIDYCPIRRDTGNEYCVNVLLNGVWLGKAEDITYLHMNLLVPMLQSDDQVFRAMCLKELERDALQYRLLHKGYEHFFAWRQEVPNEIDGNCPFYSFGYRKIASLLFFKKVFMPRLVKRGNKKPNSL